MVEYMTIVFILCVIRSTHSTETHSCDNTAWTLREGHCYYVSWWSITWVNASDWCDSRDAELTSILTEDEDDIIQSITPQDTYYWIGLRWQGYQWKRHLYWVDDAGITYNAAWSQGEPDGRGCVRMRNKEWRDSSCSLGGRFVCKKKMHTCYKYWEFREDHCYYVSLWSTTWLSASDWCVSWDAELTSILTEAEDDFIQSITLNDTHYWIGLRWQHYWVDWNFYWVGGGGILTYNATWSTNEPDRSGCVRVRNKKWRDSRCSKEEHFVCKKDATVIPIQPTPRPATTSTTTRTTTTTTVPTSATTTIPKVGNTVTTISTTGVTSRQVSEGLGHLVLPVTLSVAAVVVIVVVVAVVVVCMKRRKSVRRERNHAEDNAYSLPPIKPSAPPPDMAPRDLRENVPSHDTNGNNPPRDVNDNSDPIEAMYSQVNKNRPDVRGLELRDNPLYVNHQDAATGGNMGPSYHDSPVRSEAQDNHPTSLNDEVYTEVTTHEVTPSEDPERSGEAEGSSVLNQDAYAVVNKARSSPDDVELHDNLGYATFE